MTRAEWEAWKDRNADWWDAVAFIVLLWIVASPFAVAGWVLWQIIKAAMR